MSTLEVNTITPQSGTTLTLGGSGQTIALGSGTTAGFGKIGSFTSHSDHTVRTTTSTSYTDTGIAEQSVTAINANAKFHINLFVNQRAQSDQMEVTVYYKVGSGGSYSNFQNVGGRNAFTNLYPNSGNNETVSCAGSYTKTISNSAGDTIYFKVYFKCHNSTQAQMVNDLSPATIQIMEILT